MDSNTSIATDKAISQFNVLPNYDVVGSDCCGSPFMNSNEEDCAARCVETEFCLGFTLQVNETACWLKYNVARSAEKMWVTSGLLLGDLFQARVNESHAWDMRHVKALRGNFRTPRSRGEQAKEQAVVLILFFGMIAAQYALHAWRQKHPKAYHRTTLFGMWVIPPMAAFYMHFNIFLGLFIVFALVMGGIVRLATRRPLTAGTPRLVYRAFSLVHNAFYGIAVAAFTIVLVQGFTMIFTILHLDVVVVVAVVVLLCGLYFGVLARDMADLTSEQMAASIGYTGRSGKLSNDKIPPNLCILCGQQLDALIKDSTTINDPLITLACGHKFHELCIRGWAIIGKKDTCPVCCEKVDTASIARSSPWEKTSILWAQGLDSIRYLVVWNPVIILLMHFGMTATGLTHVRVASRRSCSRNWTRMFQCAFCCRLYRLVEIPMW